MPHIETRKIGPTEWQLVTESREETGEVWNRNQITVTEIYGGVLIRMTSEALDYDDPAPVKPLIETNDIAYTLSPEHAKSLAYFLRVRANRKG